MCRVQSHSCTHWRGQTEPCWTPLANLSRSPQLCNLYSLVTVVQPVTNLTNCNLLNNWTQRVQSWKHFIEKSAGDKGSSANLLQFGEGRTSSQAWATPRGASEWPFRVILCKSACVICFSCKGYMKCKLLPLERVLLGMCLKLYENHQGYETKGSGKIKT